MKRFIMLSLSALAVLSACNRPKKDLASVTIGMTKTEVVNMIGEPKKKDVVNKTEIWDYTDSSRTVVFRADTVYSIMTSPKARLDSVAGWLDSTNQKVKKGFGNLGEKVDNAADKIKDKLDKDSPDSSQTKQ
ncbi:outer membrane protein assembly factor BamE domain-containing protein [Desertivirga xinjiangensis]|uniref:outer membrane protein assembly factor BamE domain-containing protein n=1 Tax=Desertivirga xinjiangensis TaxID=539206 RepID=UPI00210D9D79|nr:outer membrane protein assembly factor BamE [Pedobacter xinjiangensis]